MEVDLLQVINAVQVYVVASLGIAVSVVLFVLGRQVVSELITDDDEKIHLAGMDDHEDDDLGAMGYDRGDWWGALKRHDTDEYLGDQDDEERTCLD